MTRKSTKKSAAKKAKPIRKAAAKTANTKGKPASPEMLADLTEVFKKHGWTGLPQHLAFAATSGVDDTCPDGSPRKQITIRCPGGMTKVVFICPGDDPGC